MNSRNLPVPVPNSKPRPARLSVYSLLCEEAPPQPKGKRPRRRRDEIERFYKCSFSSCAKAYGTLNHLNAHVASQGHGEKRKPEEFKELRAIFRQQKKDEHENWVTFRAQQQFQKSKTYASDHHNSLYQPRLPVAMRMAGSPF